MKDFINLLPTYLDADVRINKELMISFVVFFYKTMAPF